MKRVSLVVLGVFLMTASHHAAETYSFSSLNFPGSALTIPVAINARGDVVGYYEAVLNGPESGFLYQDGRYESIVFPGAIGTTEAIGISNSDEIVGDFYCGSVFCRHAFVLDHGQYAVVEPPAAIYSLASSINNRGQIVGYAIYPNSEGFFIYDRGVFTTLPTVGGSGSYTGLNSAGALVGFASGVGFLISHGETKVIAFPGAAATQARAINDSATVAGTYATDTNTRSSFVYV